MAYRAPEEITHKGVKLSDALEAHARWLEGRADGEYLDWRGAYMRDADMRDAYMRGADMSGANMRDADMRGAYMRDADMSDAYMRYANMRGADMRGAYMRGANMRGANMRGADMRGADLWGATGNMREIKSAQFDTWPLTWTTAPDGVVTLQIGCQRHTLDLWEESDPRWIAALDPGATEWWAKYRDIVLALVKASPATPYGKKDD